MKWCTLFSQTGSEIYQISERLGRYPDMIICNKQDNFKNINQNLIGKAPIIFTDKKPTTEQYLHYLPADALITMHGWLRIVPSEVCDNITIYNGHPGLITEWPELKGKDPQERAFYSRHETAGCVIHEAVAEVDAGEILKEGSVDIKGLTLDKVYSTLHEVSVNLWVEFLEEKFNAVPQ